ncbi:hypothetical protein Tco_0652052 [Tanacetum coccineum]|uniref:Uncharacterized protein n=1 Tax=Tanacetum coccineum TaxID=301880 RepID=A0ABQ4WWH7_9ASTR
MSGTIPPIPPPFGASSGNPGSLNVNRVDTMPATTNPINTTNTTNVSQSVVDENLPQLLDSRGGSHVTNVLAFDKKDFTNEVTLVVVLLRAAINRANAIILSPRCLKYFTGDNSNFCGKNLQVPADLVPLQSTLLQALSSQKMVVLLHSVSGPIADIKQCSGNQAKKKQIKTLSAFSDAGPSIEERTILFLEAQDRVKKDPLFKRS